MNEQIRELAKQAELYAVRDNSSMLLENWKKHYTEKFAELIVAECANIIDRGNGEMSSMAETTWCNICRDHILNHFGVEQ
jgi:hypothetical protein